MDLCHFFASGNRSRLRRCRLSRKWPLSRRHGASWVCATYTWTFENHVVSYAHAHQAYVPFHCELRLHTIAIPRCVKFHCELRLQYHCDSALCKITIDDPCRPPYSPLHQTSSLESFHNVIIHFAPKSIALSYHGMISR